MDSVQMVSSDGVRLSILRQPVSAGPASHVRSMAAATKQPANTQLWLGVLSGCSCDAADKAVCSVQPPQLLPHTFLPVRLTNSA